MFVYYLHPICNIYVCIIIIKCPKLLKKTITLIFFTKIHLSILHFVESKIKTTFSLQKIKLQNTYFVTKYKQKRLKNQTFWSPICLHIL